MAKNKRYKIVYLLGEKFDHKAKGKSGVVDFSEGAFSFVGENNFAIAPKDVRTVQLARPQGFGQNIKFQTSADTLWMMVPRINIGGSFVIVNLSKTMQLCHDLQAIIGQESA